MHLQFLIEDKSTTVLIEHLMKNQMHNDSCSFDIKSFHGIGHLPKKKTVPEVKTGMILNDLGKYLTGFDKSLHHPSSAIIIVLDNDGQIKEDFLKELHDLANQNQITIDHVFCIAVEEMEAWLLGDQEAIIAAYPNAKKRVLKRLQNYVPDSACGRWATLAEAIYPKDYAKKLKECTPNYKIGKYKIDWASKIGPHMKLDDNKSPSFNYFVDEVRRRCAKTV